MDKEGLIRSQFDAIRRLEYTGFVDHHFRECYLLKEESGSRFFIDLISNFSFDVEEVVKQMRKTLMKQPLVDFHEMNELCIKLKGSASWIGACRISAVCSDLRYAVENKSKQGCLQGLSNIKNEAKNLRSLLKEILTIEQELISKNS